MSGLAPSSLEDEGDGGNIGSVLRNGFLHGGIEFSGTVLVKEPDKVSGLHGDGFAAFEGGIKESLRLRDGEGKASVADRTCGLAFKFEEFFLMRRIENHLMSVV